MATIRAEDDDSAMVLDESRLDGSALAKFWDQAVGAGLLWLDGQPGAPGAGVRANGTGSCQRRVHLLTAFPTLSR